MKYLFDALEDRLSEFPALMLKGRKLLVGFEEANVNAVKPYTELNAKLINRLDTFESDVEVWDLNFRYHADDIRSTDAETWVEEMIVAMKDANVKSGVFTTAGCAMIEASVPKLTNGTFDASARFQLTIQREQELPIQEDGGTGITPATIEFSASADLNIETGILQDVNLDGTSLNVGVISAGGKLERTLFYFDLTSIPTGATITSAILDLYVSIVSGGATLTKLYRLTRPTWSETQATWIRYTTLNSWSLAGGDFTDTDPAGVNWTPGAADTHNLIDVMTLVQEAIDDLIDHPKQLHLLIRNDDETPPVKFILISDKDNADSTKRPKLTVSYA